MYYTKRLVYARGSYLESVKLASEFSGINVESILTQGDLVWLKTLDIRWMRIGLRMNECLSIFKKRIVKLSNNRWTQTKLSIFITRCAVLNKY